MSTQGNGPEIASPAQKKRLLFVVTQSEMGGAQQFIAQLVSHLDADRFQWALVVGEDGAGELRHILPTNTEYAIARHLKRNPSIVSDVLSIFELHRIYRQFHPDIIFLNSSKAGFNGSIAAWGFPARVIYRIGGWAFNDPRPWWQRFFYRLLEQISARWKDEIVVNSQKDFDDAQRLHIRPRNAVHMTHNGIDPYQEFLTRDEARVQLQNKVGRPGIFQNVPLIGTIANFYPAKGLQDLVAAAQHVPDARFVLIGDGMLRKQLEQEIITRGLTQRVFLAGRLDHAAQYLPAFDVFVLPSHKEGFPWAVLEAIAAKVPVVATQVGAIPEIIENGVSGLVVSPGKPHELGNALKQILSDERMQRELPIQAHQKLLKEFSIRTMVQRYEMLF